MKKESMTALISLFARAYHREHNKIRIFDDSVAGRLLTECEYERIAERMADGIGWFCPSFQGTEEEALRWVVDNQLSPAVLGRAAFAERALQTAVRLGTGQLLILGAGYDTFAFRQPEWAKKLSILEVDHPATAEDKQSRLNYAGVEIPGTVCFVAADFEEWGWERLIFECERFSRDKISFCSLLGVVYYVSGEVFKSILSFVSALPCGSALAFDYPEKNRGERAEKQAALAEAAQEKMQTGFTCREMEKLLADYGLLVYEHLTPQEMTEQYFSAYNAANPSHRMTAMENTNYCLAVKR